MLPWEDGAGAAGAAAGGASSSSGAQEGGGDGALWSMLSGEASGDDRASGDLLASRSLTQCYHLTPSAAKLSALVLLLQVAGPVPVDDRLKEEAGQSAVAAGKARARRRREQAEEAESESDIDSDSEGGSGEDSGSDSDEDSDSDSDSEGDEE